MKKCFKCKRNLPLFMYYVNNSTYQREADKGVTIECRICVFKRIKEQNGIIIQRINGKFVNVDVNKYLYFFKK